MSPFGEEAWITNVETVQQGGNGNGNCGSRGSGSSSGGGGGGGDGGSSTGGGGGGGGCGGVMEERETKEVRRGGREGWGDSGEREKGRVRE